jgi:hypothetical protein
MLNGEWRAGGQEDGDGGGGWAGGLPESGDDRGTFVLTCN